MRNSDKEMQEICSINFKEKGFILQKVINKGGEEMFIIVDSNNKEDEVMSCYSLDLGDMLQYLINGYYEYL